MKGKQHRLLILQSVAMKRRSNELAFLSLADSYPLVIPAQHYLSSRTDNTSQDEFGYLADCYCLYLGLVRIVAPPSLGNIVLRRCDSLARLAALWQRSDSSRPVAYSCF